MLLSSLDTAWLVTYVLALLPLLFMLVLVMLLSCSLIADVEGTVVVVLLELQCFRFLPICCVGNLDMVVLSIIKGLVCNVDCLGINVSFHVILYFGIVTFRCDKL